MTVSSILSYHLFVAIVQSLLWCGVMWLGYRGGCLWFYRREHSAGAARQKAARLKYVLVAVLVLGLLRIWIDDFSSIFTALGLVSAGLVVTNKETIMNFVGWLVILWRDLFVEGDYIEVQGYSGYVIRVGTLYYALADMPPEDARRSSGKLMKVPNSTVITSIIANYAHEAPYQVTIEAACVRSEEHLALVERIEHTVNEQLQRALERLDDSLRLRIAPRIQHSARVIIKPDADKPGLLRLAVSFFCYLPQREELEKDINAAVISLLPE